MKKLFLIAMAMVFATTTYAQTEADAYIFDQSGTPTNVRNSPNGKVVQTLPEIDGGYVVSLLEARNKWWKIDPVVFICGDSDDEQVKLKGSKTGYWVHYSVLGFGITGDPKNVLRETPSSKGKPLNLNISYLLDVGLRPLEIKGKWIKVITTDGRHTGWMPIDRICSNPLTTCP